MVDRLGPDTEKITVNLSFIDLGSIDLLVRESAFANRTDFIRTAIRNELTRQEDIVGQVKKREALTLGIRHVTRSELEKALSSGEKLELRVLGLLSLAADIDEDLAHATIGSISILGAFHAPQKLKAALADRLA